MEKLFVVKSHQPTLAYDQTSRHPISASVNTTSEIRNVFDAISYGKAASVLKMLRDLVTEELFMSSLRSYLKANM